jgi:hypothetical protein
MAIISGIVGYVHRGVPSNLRLFLNRENYEILNNITRDMKKYDNKIKSKLHDISEKAGRKEYYSEAAGNPYVGYIHLSFFDDNLKVKGVDGKLSVDDIKINDLVGCTVSSFTTNYAGSKFASFSARLVIIHERNVVPYPFVDPEVKKENDEEDEKLLELLISKAKSQKVEMDQDVPF